MENEVAHRKRLAQILRYIASMHQSLNNGEGTGHSFVRDSTLQEARDVSDFFQNEGDAVDDRQCGVFFSTNNFRRLLAIEQQTNKNTLFDNPPFSFYAATSSEDRKRTFTGALKSTWAIAAGRTTLPEKACWLRITRLTPKQVPVPPLLSHPTVKRYLQDWISRTPNVRSVERLLTLDRLAQAPKLPPTASAQEGQEVKAFLRQYKKYLYRKTYQQVLEPMYNLVFEWLQSPKDNELVVGLGHACRFSGDRFVNGPLLEILVEVELAPDGALLIRPREHSGVALNREVVAALATTQQAASDLHQAVAELEPSTLSPGQPATYVNFLKRVAVELSPGGVFQQSTLHNSNRDWTKLLVSEAWCLYSRPKPSSVWARDATAFADQLMRQDSSFQVPIAAWSLTYGPNVMEKVVAQSRDGQKGKVGFGLWLWGKVFRPLSSNSHVQPELPPFPLPTSDAQNRIANLLLLQNFPAVVCLGPPGTGKTHSIANIVCAYLCQGKRVLVTSKNAPALSVLRDRLPLSVQELCVDVSMSELTGMRQLQRTVERLANRISCADTEMEHQKCEFIKSNIAELRKQLLEIDLHLHQQSDHTRLFMATSQGEQLSELGRELIDRAPWLANSLPSLSQETFKSLAAQTSSLLIKDGDPLMDVNGIVDGLPSQALLSLAKARAGSSMASISTGARHVIASIPLLGSFSGISKEETDAEEAMLHLTIQGRAPESDGDWQVVSKALEHRRSVILFSQQTWKHLEESQGWPTFDFTDRFVAREIHNLLEKGVQVKTLVEASRARKVIQVSIENRLLDARRSKITSQLQRLAEELVDATVLMELSESFSPDAQSALIHFSQMAGKSKFSRSAQMSKMTQRQRRKRQEYLDAFNRCCRFIPCWILTASQISDYLPSESLFDLVVVDEASQSDVTILPGMLRGKQWLIVGDGKQVSPTEVFVSEEQIDSLRSALPQSPLQGSLLPGHSFFDLCSQAFPRGRVVLNEHFRCAESIISFSNDVFYDGALVPLRLPTMKERMNPTILDIRVDGVKVGKVNEVEADRIVELVHELLCDPDFSFQQRSVGVISLVGDEQSRLIRGRLLDAIGPEKIAQHRVLVGDPPSFQGAERDVVFLSMVCSRGHVPTQNQLMHFQRGNVAMSRARDRCVLVRSLDLADIPSRDDVKVQIIEYFSSQQDHQGQIGQQVLQVDRPFKTLLTKILEDRGFAVRSMGTVWRDALCVESQGGDPDARAAILVESDGEPSHQWKSNFLQQKAIERVGWKSLRIDALSMIVDLKDVVTSVIDFLSMAGVEGPGTVDVEDNDVASIDVGIQIEVHNGVEQDLPPENPLEDEVEVVTISSNEESVRRQSKRTGGINDMSDEFPPEDEFDAGEFGEVVQLDFLRERGLGRPASGREESSSSEASDGDHSGDEEEPARKGYSRRRKNRRLDSYA